MPRGKKKFESKDDVMPKVPIQELQPYSPKPDMGTVKPPEEKDRHCSTCKHIGASHYGGLKNWCNFTGCSCQEFK